MKTLHLELRFFSQLLIFKSQIFLLLVFSKLACLSPEQESPFGQNFLEEDGAKYFSTDNPRFNYFFELMKNAQIPSLMVALAPRQTQESTLVFNEENNEDLRFMKDLFKNHQNGKIGDIAIPTSYLLHGPRGNGKKSWIYNLASEVGAHVVYVNCLALDHPYFQVAAMRLHQLFEIAFVLYHIDRKKVFLILENLDAITPKSGMQASPSLVRDLEMGFSDFFTRGGFTVFTFATAEDHTLIDRSLLGREKLGFLFEFTNPRETTRMLYIEKLAQKYAFAHELDLASWAQKLCGLNFAGIESVANNAYFQAKKENRSAVIDKDLTAAFKSFQAGETMQGGHNINASAMRSEHLDGESSLSVQIWPQGTVQCSFGDVIADEKIKEEVSDIILFIKEPERFAKTKGRVPNGVILYGPTGTGKTLFAKALAGEAGCSFISVNASLLTSKFLGDSSRNVQNLFKLARKTAQKDGRCCIIFIDEIDSFGGRRNSSYGTVNDDNRQMLNQLLCELDGFGTEHGSVLLVAATNRFEDLDEALKRPGRLDRHIYLPLPLLTLRKEMFILASTKFNFGPDVNYDLLAQMTVNFSGAEIMNMANEAAILAAKLNKDFITQEDLLAAHSKVTLGVENRSLRTTKETRLITAYHESGHALLAMLNPHATPLKQVTCIPRGFTMGVTLCRDDEDKMCVSEQTLFANLTTLFGGLVAEEMLSGFHDTGSSNDLRKATDLAERMVCDFGMSSLGKFCARSNFVNKEKIAEAITDLLNRAENTARELLESNKVALQRLAETLLKKETLSVSEVEALLTEVAKDKAAAALDATNNAQTPAAAA